ncbi:hypothetical protein BJV78DRAFT_1175543 [Lactifluus subvellereus]|nr:hypothetical protein BJV78DRAFT_1175543 [Lactifluus subvellereus]
MSIQVPSLFLVERKPIVVGSVKETGDTPPDDERWQHDCDWLTAKRRVGSTAIDDSGVFASDSSATDMELSPTASKSRRASTIRCAYTRDAWTAGSKTYVVRYEDSANHHALQGNYPRKRSLPMKNVEAFLEYRTGTASFQKISQPSTSLRTGHPVWASFAICRRISERCKIQYDKSSNGKSFLKRPQSYLSPAPSRASTLYLRLYLETNG